jgi:hypothetical protein
MNNVDPLFRNILNAVSGQSEAITAMRSDIKLKSMENTKTLNVEQVQALNKVLDLIHDLMGEVTDDLVQERYERRYQKILDKLYPERLTWRKQGESNG